MAQLREEYESYTAKNAEIVVVGPEDQQAFSRYFGEHALPFVGLPDPTSSVLKLYGQEVNLFKLGRMPAMLVVDSSGIVRFVHYGHEMSDIPENQEVLAALDEINKGAK